MRPTSYLNRRLSPPRASNGHADHAGVFALPTVLTNSALFQGSYSTFLHEKYDEALKHSRENALAMRRDAWLLSLLRERIDGTLSLNWEIEVENPKDRRQKEVADGLTK